jgi:hypothetical protein
MIELRYIDGRTCPVVICDRCGEQITTGRGNVEWRMGDPAGPDVDPGTGFRIVHKPFDCRAAETREERVEWFLSQELTHFLAYLIRNTGVDVDEANGSVDALLRMGL